MDSQDLELTVEDILNLHRAWITKLYVEEKMSEVEIAHLLHERRIIVRVSQIHRCLKDWGLVLPFNFRSSAATYPQSYITSSKETVSRLSSSIPRSLSHDLQIQRFSGEFSNKSPPILQSISPKESLSSSNSKAKMSHIKIKLACHHIAEPKQSNQVETRPPILEERLQHLQTSANSGYSYAQVSIGSEGTTRQHNIQANQLLSRRLQWYLRRRQMKEEEKGQQ